MLHPSLCFNAKNSIITYLPSLSVIMKFRECLIWDRVSHIHFRCLGRSQARCPRVLAQAEGLRQIPEPGSVGGMAQTQEIRGWRQSAGALVGVRGVAWI